MLVEPHGAPGRVRGVEQRLRCRVGVGRSEHTRAQPVARDDIGLVQRQIGDELDGPAGPIGREILPESVEAGRQVRAAARRRRREPAPSPRRPALSSALRPCRACGSRASSRSGRHQLLDVPGRRIRLEMGPHDASHRVEGGAVAIDQDGQITGGDRVQGDHGGASRGRREEGRGGSPQKSTCRAMVGRPPSRTCSAGSSGILGDQDRLRPGPRADGHQRRPPELRCRLAEDGQDIARLERDEPGALVVVADGEDDGHVGEEGIVVAVKSAVADVPRGAVRPRGQSDPEASPRRRRRTRTSRRTARHRSLGRSGRTCAPSRAQAQPAIGGLERIGVPGRPRSGAAGPPHPAPPRTAPVPGSDRTLNRLPIRRWRRARRAMRRRPASPGRGRPVRADVLPARGCDGWSVRPPVPQARRRRPLPAGAGASPPAVDPDQRSACLPHVATEIERGERRPVRAVTQDDRPRSPRGCRRAGPRRSRSACRTAPPRDFGRCTPLQWNEWRGDREDAGDGGRRCWPRRRQRAAECRSSSA